MLQIFLKFSGELPGAKTRFVSSVIHELNARDPSRVSSKDLCVLLQSLVILGKHCSHTRSQVTQAHMRRCLQFLKGSSFKIFGDVWKDVDVFVSPSQENTSPAAHGTCAVAGSLC